jgi:two-component system OmpR family sensor kinase
VASLDSSIRSAARATSSAYRRLPIRWRLAGGSAALTLVILCGFAAIVGVLTTRQIREDFRSEVASSADKLEKEAELRPVAENNRYALRPVRDTIDLDDFAASQNAAIRVITQDDTVYFQTERAPDFGVPFPRTIEAGGWRIENRPVQVVGVQSGFFLQYARRTSEIQDTTNRVKVFLAFGVLGGALLALLAGLATARRAMEPIAQLTEAARKIERARDPSLKLPHPEAEDEVAELARTLDAMLGALDDARSETEGALTRQREFVADASHELRRLVADLLLLARADAGRVAPHQPVDLSEVVTHAAAELEPLAGDHEISISAPAGAHVDGARDELHRLVLNLMENALRHTDPGTAVEATVERQNGQIVLAVEDDGPGIPVDQREKVFERFYRGTGDRSGSSGLGLSIVRAVAESHKGTVRLEEPLDGRGARFVVRIPTG